MNTRISTAFVFSVLLILSGCSTTYEAKPLPFQLPSAFNNAVSVEKISMGARAFAETKEAGGVFGFDVLGAGLLPVQVTFDNQGDQAFQIKTSQTFLIIDDGSLWPVLDWNTVHERSSEHAGSKEIMKALKNKNILANEITYGYLFFPVEAKTAKQLRMQVEDLTSKKIHTLLFDLH